MEIQSVISYKAPAYPDKEKAMRNPNILKKLPERWKNNALVCAMISGLFTMMLTSCNFLPRAKTVGTTRQDYLRLTEEEAFAIISSEAARQGIEFSKESFELDNIDLPKSIDNNAVTEKGTLQLDGIDKDKKIGFEFVSIDDVSVWTGKQKEQLEINFQFIKDTLDNSLKNNQKINVGVFCDPNAINQENAESNLRKQVQDFIQWLKAENII